ncbi:unnamed protein product [Adineta steineri]|nr:unnamed protein product [Adineta steineri]CAF1618859.1 unnamed protein product [Adineta steineri]
MAQLCEASTILKRLSERLYQYSNCQQPDIDSLQQIIDSPLFNTLYNLQESFQQLKVEFEKGNPSIKDCSFDFDLEGHLKFISKKITNQNIKNNKRLANDNILRKIILTKQTPDESLGFSIIEKKHRLFDINAIFIEGIQSNGITEL